MTSNKLMMITTAFAICAMDFDAANAMMAGEISALAREQDERMRSEYRSTHLRSKKLRFSDGKLYNGDVKKDNSNTPDGMGTLRYQDGSMLKAYFLDGTPQEGYKYMFELFSESFFTSKDTKDVGKLKYADDDALGRKKFMGKYGADCLPSYGTLTYRDGYNRMQFTGSFCDGLPYNGFLINRSLDGKGKLELDMKDGEVYPKQKQK